MIRVSLGDRVIGAALMAAVIAIAVTGCEQRNEVTAATPAAPIVADLSGADAAIGAAIDEIMAQVRLDPDDPALRGRLAMAYEVNGFADAALQSYRQAETMDPSSPNWPYYQALLVAHRGDLDGALAHLQRSLDIDADYSAAWLWRGTWLLDQDHLLSAEESFARAATLDAGAPAAAGLARVHLRRGDADGALGLLKPHGSSSLPYVERLLGQAYRQIGDMESARRHLARVSGQAPVTWPDPRGAAKKQHEQSIGSVLDRARQDIRSGNPGAALARIEPLRAARPTHQGLLTVLAESYRRLGRDKESLETLRAGVEAHPDFYGFHLNLADQYLRGGQPALAMRHLERTVALNPTVAWAHAQIGLYHLERGDVKAGLDALERGLREEPENPQINYYMGMVYASGGDLMSAAAHFDRAVETDGNFAPALVALARSEIGLGRLPAAEESLSRAVAAGASTEEVAAARKALARAVQVGQ